MKNSNLPTKITEIKQKLLQSIRNNPTTWSLSVIILIAIFKDLEFLALMGMILLLVRNDPQLGVRLRHLFVKVGKEGLEFREPPEETVTADKETKEPQLDPQSQDYIRFTEANKSFQQNNLPDAEQKYLQIINDGSIQNIIKDSYLNLGAVYLKLWHQTHEDDFLGESIEASKKALQLDPQGYRSRLNLAVAYSKRKETEPEALTYFEEADNIGDMRDPITWGKVKLFKASVINSLSAREDGNMYANKLQEAELSLLDSLRLFDTMKYHPEASWLAHEARTLIGVVRKRIAQSR